MHLLQRSPRRPALLPLSAVAEEEGMKTAPTENLNMGDVCEIVEDVDQFFPGMVGRECTIVGPLEPRRMWDPRRHDLCEPALTFLVQVQGERYPLCARPEELRRKKPPTAKWEDCAWQPEEITA